MLSTLSAINSLLGTTAELCPRHHCEDLDANGDQKLDLSELTTAMVSLAVLVFDHQL